MPHHYAFANAERTAVIGPKGAFPWDPLHGRPNLRAAFVSELTEQDLVEGSVVDAWRRDGAPTPR